MFAIFKAKGDNSGKVLKEVIVKRDGKTFRRKQWVRVKDDAPGKSAGGGSSSDNQSKSQREQFNRLTSPPGISQIVEDAIKKRWKEAGVSMIDPKDRPKVKAIEQKFENDFMAAYNVSGDAHTAAKLMRMGFSQL